MIGTCIECSQPADYLHKGVEYCYAHWLAVQHINITRLDHSTLGNLEITVEENV